jgi:antitoxin FitA
MATLVVRGLDDALVRALKLRAAARGRSAEEEHREILRAMLTGPVRRPLAAVLLQIPGYGWKWPR